MEFPLRVDRAQGYPNGFLRFAAPLETAGMAGATLLDGRLQVNQFMNEPQAAKGATSISD
jgi:hypothetical protein